MKTLLSFLLICLALSAQLAQAQASAVTPNHATFADGRVALIPPAGWQTLEGRGAANPSSDQEFLMVLWFRSPINDMAPNFPEPTPKESVMSGQNWTTTYREFGTYRAHVNLVEQGIYVRSADATVKGKSYIVLIEYEKDKSFLSVGFNPVPDSDPAQATKLAEMLKAIDSMVVLAK